MAGNGAKVHNFTHTDGGGNIYVSITSSAAQLASNTPCEKAYLFNPTGNNTVEIGFASFTSGTGTPLASNTGLSVTITNLNQIYARGTSGERLHGFYQTAT